MAEDLRIALQELLRKAELDGDVDFLRDGVRVLAQELIKRQGLRPRLHLPLLERHASAMSR